MTLDVIPSAAVSAWAEALQHNTHLTKLNLTVTKFDVADVHAIRTALQLNATLIDVTFDLGGVKPDDRWWTLQLCANACRAAGASWRPGGWHGNTKLSSRDVVHLAAALADPTVCPPLALLSSSLLFFASPFLYYVVRFVAP